MPDPIIILDYDPTWPHLFQLLRERIAAKLGSIAVRIEHVGSTSVPGLAAKPIIDIDVLLAADNLLNEAIERLAQIGYNHQGDLGIAGREAFKAPKDYPPHHLYVCSTNSSEFARHLAFRDFLRANPVEAREYGDLKRSLADKFRENREAYADGKAEFIAKLLNRTFVDRACMEKP